MHIESEIPNDRNDNEDFSSAMMENLASAKFDSLVLLGKIDQELCDSCSPSKPNPHISVTQGHLFLSRENDWKSVTIKSNAFTHIECKSWGKNTSYLSQHYIENKDTVHVES